MFETNFNFTLSDVSSAPLAFSCQSEEFEDESNEVSLSSSSNSVTYSGLVSEPDFDSDLCFEAFSVSPPNS